MLGFVFGLNARIGRLHFFLSCLVLAAAMTAAAFVLAGYIFRRTPVGLQPSFDQFLVPIALIALFFMAITFTLQSMRIRDIGWNPAYVLPAWIALMIADACVATTFPSVTIGEDHSTIIGLLVSLTFNCALLLCPSDFYQPSAAAGPEDRRPRPAPLPTEASTVQAPFNSSGAQRAGFGRRGI